ncbi:MAG: DUF2283 domain-containing protein [Patescibacteria group bacterium]
MKLYYYYDQEADVFYFSKGKPSAKDQSKEKGDDVALRIDPKSKKVKGFTIFNFARRIKQRRMPVSLPIEAELMPA